MKKIILLLFILLGIITISVKADLTLNSNEINLLTDKGYILSDNYTSLKFCNDIVNKYNFEYPDYDRSDCFYDGIGYKYFICSINQNCKIDLGGDKSINLIATSSSVNLNIPNKNKLDKFLDKVRSIKQELNNNEKYEKFLNQIYEKLDKLGNKYQKNNTINQMVVYLKDGIDEMKDELTKNEDIDNFFCELTDNCDKKNISLDTLNTNIVTLKVSGGMLACGDPTKNNYTTYSNLGDVKIQKDYCNEKGGDKPGKVWIVCNGKQTNIKLVNELKNNDIFSCTSTQVTPPTSSNQQNVNNTTPVSKPIISLQKIDKDNKTITFQLSNFNRFSNIMLHTNSEGRTVLQCYYVEKTEHTSQHCIPAEKISGNYISGVYKVGLTSYAIKYGLEKNSMIAILTGSPDSDVLTILSDANSPNKIIPEFAISRRNTTDGQYASWTTKNVDTLSWECSSSNGVKFSNQKEVINKDQYYFTWAQLHSIGWKSGIYQCIWTFTGNGVTKKFEESFSIK